MVTHMYTHRHLHTFKHTHIHTRTHSALRRAPPSLAMASSTEVDKQVSRRNRSSSCINRSLSARRRPTSPRALASRLLLFDSAVLPFST